MELLIGVVGYEGEDIAIYLAAILSAMGKKTAIVDRTEQEMLCEMVGLRTKDDTIAKEREYCGIWITNRNICQDEFDVVFYLFGYRLEHPKLYDCGALLLITDGVPAHASFMNRINNKEGMRFILIRNFLPLKHTVDYLAGLADKKAPYTEIPYNERDARERCGICGYGRVDISRLSAGMKNALLELLNEFFGYSAKELRNIIRRM